MSSEIDKLIENGESLAEAKQLYARSWADIALRLPEDFSPHHKDFARTYFRAQLRIAKGQRKRSRDIFRGLIKRAGYQDFEDGNLPLLAAIDIAVRGSTSWQDNLKRLVKPLFRLNGS